MGGIEAICCFCGDPILNIEPMALRLRLSNIHLEEGSAPSQGLYAHAVCLRDALHKTIPFVAESLLDE